MLKGTWAAQAQSLCIFVLCFVLCFRSCTQWKKVAAQVTELWHRLLRVFHQVTALSGLSWDRVPLHRHVVTAFEKEGTEALGLLLSHARRTWWNYHYLWWNKDNLKAEVVACYSMAHVLNGFYSGNLLPWNSTPGSLFSQGIFPERFNPVHCLRQKTEWVRHCRVNKRYSAIWLQNQLLWSSKLDFAASVVCFRIATTCGWNFQKK